MKFLLFILPITVLFSSCKSDTEKIIGEWQAVNYKYLSPELEPGLEDESEEIALSYNFKFKSDGTFLFNDFLKFERHGKWKISNGYLELETVVEQMHEYGPKPDRKSFNSKYKIESLTSTELVLIESGGISKLSFEKRND